MSNVVAFRRPSKSFRVFEDSDGRWHYEPVNFTGAGFFSIAYPSRAEAMAAALLSEEYSNIKEDD